jgi:hypothetical protein
MTTPTRTRRLTPTAFGVLAVVGLPVIDTANFLGYVLWCLWLVALAVVIVVHERRAYSREPATSNFLDRVGRRV